MKNETIKNALSEIYQAIDQEDIKSIYAIQDIEKEVARLENQITEMSDAYCRMVGVAMFPDPQDQ